MDEAHLIGALRYVALNPVQARLVEPPEDWRWSSRTAHITGAGDRFVDVVPGLKRVSDLAAFLVEAFDEALSYAAPLRAARKVSAIQWS